MRKGDLYKVTGISLEVDEKVRNRLEELGLFANQLVICLRRSAFNGPIVLQLGGSAFALEQDVAQLVMAESCI